MFRGLQIPCIINIGIANSDGQLQPLGICNPKEINSRICNPFSGDLLLKSITSSTYVLHPRNCKFHIARITGLWSFATYHLTRWRTPRMSSREPLCERETRWRTPRMSSREPLCERETRWRTPCISSTSLQQIGSRNACSHRRLPHLLYGRAKPRPDQPSR